MKPASLTGVLFEKTLHYMCIFSKTRLFEVLFLFVCFVALRPKSTAMVIVGGSVNLTTLFPGQA